MRTVTVGGVSDTTVMFDVELLCDESGSFDWLLTVAVLLNGPAWVGDTTIVAVADAPLAIDPSAHVTVPFASAHPVLPDTYVTPAGSTSLNTMPVAVSGPLSDYVCQADSGSTMHRRFCTRCGTQVFSEAEERPTVTFVRAGTLDDPNLAAPTATIWTKSAPKWACFDPALPKVEKHPPPLKV